MVGVAELLHDCQGGGEDWGMASPYFFVLNDLYYGSFYWRFM